MTKKELITDWNERFDQQFSGCKNPDEPDRLLCTFDAHHEHIKSFISQEIAKQREEAVDEFVKKMMKSVK